MDTYGWQAMIQNLMCLLPSGVSCTLTVSHQGSCERYRSTTPIMDAMNESRISGVPIMGTTARMASVKEHLGHLDALRGIAILGVFVVHAALLTQQANRSLMFGFTGQRGVQLFYVISSFTLCLSLDVERREHYPLSNYFLRRFFRIAPLFYAVIIVNLLLLRIAPEHSSLRELKHGDIIVGFLFLNGLNPLTINSVVAGGWSIAVETTFYLILPWLYHHFNTVRRSLILFVIAAPILGGFSRFLARSSPNSIYEQYFAFLWFPVEFPVFVLGILAYCLWRDHIKGRVKNSDRSKDVSLALLLGSFMLYCGSLPFTDRQLYFSSFLFLPLILSLSIHAWPILVNRITRFLGKISYSLYLVHFFSLALIAHLLRLLDNSSSHLATRYVYHRVSGLGLVLFLLIGISVPVCVLTWRFLEQPGIRLGQRLIAIREGGRQMAASIPLVPPLEALDSGENTPESQF